MTNSVDLDDTLLRAISSGSALFARVSVLVCKNDWVKQNSIFQDTRIGSVITRERRKINK